MTPYEPVLLPADELLARPLIVAWLSYPKLDMASARDRSILLIQDWARHLSRLPMAARSDNEGRTRLDRALLKMDKFLDRQFLAGEYFRRQVLTALPDDIGLFSNPSSMALATYIMEERSKEIGRHDKDDLDHKNLRRDYWQARQPCLALAVGSSYGLATRPTLKQLLFGSREWAMQAIRESEKIRTLAIEIGHPLAQDQMEFRFSHF